MSIAENHDIVFDAPPESGGRIAPVLMGIAFLLICAFGVMLAAHAPDQQGYVEGFGFMIFSLLMTMYYFGKKV
ncbi:hypothetical protein [Zavarzinia sp.]|uniref:hypothetical protein n=1 Tax=Zavarzinia sp. TaxID=2027920 RepID=UPI003569C462